MLPLQTSTIAAGVAGRFLARRPGSGRSLRWNGPAHRARHRPRNVDHLGGSSAEAQGCVPRSTRVVDLPVYLSSSLTRLCPFAALARSNGLEDVPCPSADVLCSASSASPHCCSAYGSVVSPRGGHGGLTLAFCRAASERESGTPSTVGSADPAARSQSMEKPAEGAAAPGSRGRPKTAARQIASTPKRLTAQTERRLRAQSFTAATPAGDAANDAAEPLPLQTIITQAVRSAQTPAGGGRASERRTSAAPAAAADPAAASAPDQESPITSRQRRAPANASAGPSPAAKTPGGRAAAQHDRRGHVPPADHHAEAQTGALPPREQASAGARDSEAQAAVAVKAAAQHVPEADVGETRDAAAMQRGGKKGRSAAVEGSDGSDERGDASAAAQDADAAPAPPQHQPQQQPPPAKGAGAKVAGSLFSPVFSLFGGKPASDVPPPGPGDADAGVRSAEDGDQKAPDVTARPPSGGAKGDSAEAEPAVLARPADDDVHSENDTQIRVPSGQSSGSQARYSALECCGLRPLAARKDHPSRQ